MIRARKEGDLSFPTRIYNHWKPEKVGISTGARTGGAQRIPLCGVTWFISDLKFCYKTSCAVKTEDARDQ